MVRRSSLFISASVTIALYALGCADRNVGQVEIFPVTADGKITSFDDNRNPPPDRTDPVAKMGDSIRTTEDVIAIQIESLYLQDLPTTLTGSRDVIVFCNIWENASLGYDSPSLTTIAYLGKNQMIPGKLNFKDNIAYGATYFKGHPLRVRFTVLVLQKETSENQASAVDIISSIASAALPAYGAIIDTSAKALQALLKAQRDVIAFDFETTFTPDRPDGFRDLIPTNAGQVQNAGNRDPNAPQPAFAFDSPEYFAYGRYVLLETVNRNGIPRSVNPQFTTSPSLTAFRNPKNLVVRKGKIYPTNDEGKTDANQLPLPTSYLIFRVTPNLSPEENQTLAAASVSNAAFLKALERSKDDVKAALEQLKTAASDLQGNLLTIRADAIARDITHQIHRDPSLKNATADQKKAAFETRFNARWQAVLGTGLDTATQAKADQVKSVILNKYKSQYQDPPAASTTPAASQTPLVNPDVVNPAFAENTVTVNSRVFKITSGSVQYKPGTTELAAIANLVLSQEQSATTVHLSQLKAALIPVVNAVIKAKTGAPASFNPITDVEIQNLNALPNVDPNK